MRCGNRVCGANLCRGVALNVVCVVTVCGTGQWGQFRVFSEDVKADCSDYDEDGMGACECMAVYVALGVRGMCVVTLPSVARISGPGTGRSARNSR